VNVSSIEVSCIRVTHRVLGLDATHNPEFTTCEFYKSFTTLEELIDKTEVLFSSLAMYVRRLKETQFTSLPTLDVDFTPPFRRIDFIPALENAIGQLLPDLGAPNASAKVLQIFQDLSIEPPKSPTLPRLLDHLSSIYIEPLCVSPTFITHHPECLSPLAKSFRHSRNNQAVSSRVELFIGGREVVNAYEEENSPFEQRRKFEEQLAWRDNESQDAVDESYLEALEWGLPPTGGWGLGVDRLCMIFCGVRRINDVLSFGNLRNVVGLAGREGLRG
jgi:lysyl-tRNA synthetase, class II